METQVINYKLEEAYSKLNEVATKMDWKIEGELPSEKDINPESRNQEKKIQKAINRVMKKSSRRAFNSLFYKISRNSNLPKVTVTLGDKEKAIQLKRKEWKIAQAEAEKKLDMYKLEKGNFYKSR